MKTYYIVMERCHQISCNSLNNNQKKYKKCDICGDILKSDYVLMNVMRCDKCLCRPKPRGDKYIEIRLANSEG
jgi:hypothetical protein